MKTLVLLAYVFVLLLAALMGCSPAGELPGPSLYAYDPDPELRAAFDEAAARIYEASGVYLYADDHGVPIVLGEAKDADNDGAVECGWTYIVFNPKPFEVLDVIVHVSIPFGGRCPSEGVTIAHELIHSLRRNLPPGQHAESGIFQAQGGDHKLDEASLTMLCEAVDCTTFNPEE